MDGAQTEVNAAPADAGQVAPVEHKSEIREIRVIGQDPVETKEESKTEVQKETPKSAGSEESKEEEEVSQRDEKGRYKPRNSVQERIDELTRSRKEAEREAEYWRVRANGAQAQKPAQQQAPEGRPQRESFASDDDYQDALVDYRVGQRLAQERAESARVAQASKQAESWSSKMESARSEIQDFSEVVDNSEVPVASHVADLLMEHDDGAKVVYHLAQNPEIVEKLNNMSPTKAAFEIAKLAGQVVKPATPASSSKPAVEVSKAPKPAAQQAVGAGRSTQKSPDDMSMEEYTALRKAQGASWAR